MALAAMQILGAQGALGTTKEAVQAIPLWDMLDPKVPEPSAGETALAYSARVQAWESEIYGQLSIEDPQRDVLRSACQRLSAIGTFPNNRSSGKLVVALGGE